MRGVFLAVLFWCGAAVAGSDNRMERLQNGQALEWIEATGHWDVTFSDRQMVMICKTCEGQVEVTLDVVPRELATTRSQWKSKYFTERLLFCALLAQNGGRWLGTDPVSFRGEALQGFRSDHLENGVRSVEIVLYNRHLSYGVEVLKTQNAMHEGQLVPQGTVGLMYSAMAQLTHFW